MAKLTNVQKTTIQELIVEGKTVDEIVNKTKIAKSSVENYIEKLTESLLKIAENKAAQEQATAQSPLPTVTGPKRITAKDMFIKKTAEKGNSGVNVMTKGASEHHDEFKKKLDFVKKDNSDHIFKPLG